MPNCQVDIDVQFIGPTTTIFCCKDEDTSVKFYLTVWYHIPEDSMLHSHLYEDVISHKLLGCLKLTIIPVTNTMKFLLWVVLFTTHHSTARLSTSYKISSPKYLNGS
jgi:hypothetical protein